MTLSYSRVMEIDVNVIAHDLLWRRMSLRRKQEYIKSWGALRDTIVKDEITRLVDDGYTVQSGDNLELTSEGIILYKRMTSRCPKTD